MFSAQNVLYLLILTKSLLHYDVKSSEKLQLSCSFLQLFAKYNYRTAIFDIQWSTDAVVQLIVSFGFASVCTNG